MVTYRSQDKELDDNMIDYSGIHNWSKSKIGELRDRAGGQYGTGKYKDNNKVERMDAIDQLSVLNM